MELNKLCSASQEWENAHLELFKYFSFFTLGKRGEERNRKVEVEKRREEGVQWNISCIKMKKAKALSLDEKEDKVN